ncbi:Pyruvate decarboxylase [Fusarium oxysporum f. sp. albedinis]|nr:Pyruvate decarboxylase [Fusarium oxysporum f. sp. albedinis]
MWVSQMGGFFDVEGDQSSVMGRVSDTLSQPEPKPKRRRPPSFTIESHGNIHVMLRKCGPHQSRGKLVRASPSFLSEPSSGPRCDYGLYNCNNYQSPRSIFHC